MNRTFRFILAGFCFGISGLLLVLAAIVFVRGWGS